MNRPVQQLVPGMPTSDGAGVELVRVIGQPRCQDFDPFLLLDAFRTDDPNDYIAGFPPHPHRGFETVTYMLDGQMRHKDNAGNEGVIKSGGVQWMTAGKGIVHSEMPEQQSGLMSGFQLWVNLPASHKMTAPAYQEFDAEQMPQETRDGARIKVIAGTTSQGTQGHVVQPLTEPTYLDIELQAHAQLQESLPSDHNAFVMMISGQLNVLDDEQNSSGPILKADQCALLGAGDQIAVRAAEEGARFLLVSGRPLKEPIARGGPFVMNTEAEIQQAFADYRSGIF